MPNRIKTPQESAFAAGQAVSLRSGWPLRAMDVMLACLAVPLLAVPALLALLPGRLCAAPQRGRGSRPFMRWRIDLPDNRRGRLLRRLGAGWSPALLHILKGEMAWVGPCAGTPASQAAAHPALAALRPGLVSIWTLRMRTAVAFGTEQEADLEYLQRRSPAHDLGLLARCLFAAFLLPADAAAHARVEVGDVSFDNVDMGQALSRIGQMLDGDATRQVCFLNPACVNIAARHRAYRRVLGRAALVLPDGIGLKIAADILGRPLKQNVNGTDLFPALCKLMAARGASVFLLGGRPGVAQKVADRIAGTWPGVRIAGVRDGFFSLAQEGDVAQQVRDSGADLLLVARGVPLQDMFIDRHLHHLGVKVAIGVGGLFDFVSGRIRRAPPWMRDTGLEWVYRLMQEPGRMWRRYLVGNVTFMARIALQRMGWRRAARDATPDTAGAARPASGAALRVVLFATAGAPADVPVPVHYPACMLPLGQGTFIEAALAQLAGAGVKSLDLVLCDYPEKIRRLLGDGQRWGMSINWHIVKDASRPYDALRFLDLDQAGRVLLAHAHCHIDRGSLAVLLANHRTLARIDANGELRWTGWASLPPAAARDLRPHLDEAMLGRALCAITPDIRLIEAQRFLGAASARELLGCQAALLAGGDADAVPATWLRTPWGAHSPEALIQPGARIHGPVLVGPGCLVYKDAEVGPNTVLTSDVIVSAGSTVRDSILFPGTFVGQGLAIEQAIVNGCSVQHVGLDVRTVLPSADGLLLDIGAPAGSWRRIPGRAAAAAACLLFLPCMAVDAVLLRLRGRPARWTHEEVVASRDPATQDVTLVALRRPRPGQGRVGRLLACYGEWMDIACGRKAWLGVRPRSRSEWYALERDWQTLLSDAPIGYWQLPAWSDQAERSFESQAAADAFFVVHRGWRQRMRLGLSALKHACSARQAG